MFHTFLFSHNFKTTEYLLCELWHFTKGNFQLRKIGQSCPLDYSCGVNFHSVNVFIVDVVFPVGEIFAIKTIIKNAKINQINQTKVSTFTVYYVNYDTLLVYFLIMMSQSHAFKHWWDSKYQCDLEHRMTSFSIDFNAYKEFFPFKDRELKN